MVTAERKRTTIASASWSRPGPWGSSMFATGYVSVAGAREAGVFAGFAMPIGKDAYGAASVSTVNGRVTTQLEAAKSLGQTPGDYSWRLRDVEGANGGLREAGGAYRSQWARVEANVGQERKTARASLEVEGAVAAIVGGVFAANCIGDAFAVIDAGAPGVEVKAENRAIGRTDSRGKLLVPTLRAYERNAISIDPRSLPVDADATRTQATVTPAGRSGVVVDFGVKTDVQGAVVVVVDAAGRPLRAGSHARLDALGRSHPCQHRQPEPREVVHRTMAVPRTGRPKPLGPAGQVVDGVGQDAQGIRRLQLLEPGAVTGRSEERRVGKEGRSRRSPYH